MNFLFIKNQKTNWKYILIIFILSVFVGGGILLWSKIQDVSFTQLPEIKKLEKPLKPPQDETSGWETYRNEEFRFEIKYPTTTIYKGLRFYPVEKIDDYIVVIQDEPQFVATTNPYSPYPFSGGFGIKVIRHGTSDPVEEMKNKMRERHMTEEAIKDTFKEVTIGKLIPAIRVNNSSNKFVGYDIYIKRQDEIIIISFDNDNPGKDYYSEIFEKMLSTFKFIEKDAVIDKLLSTEIQKLENVNGEKYRVETTKRKFRIDNKDYLMAIFEIESADMVVNNIFKIYEINNDQLIDLFEIKESTVGADLKDIDKDGAPEIILGMSTGSNCWSCSWIKILKIKNEKVKPILIDFPKGVVPREVQDLDNDGIMEIIGVDTHWEFYKNVCHACSPYVSIIASLEDGVYRAASYKFPDFYNTEIKRIEAEIKGGNAEYYFGDLISLLLNYMVQGEKETGFSQFKMYKDYADLTSVFDFESRSLEAEIDRINSDLDGWIREEGVDQLTGE